MSMFNKLLMAYIQNDGAKTVRGHPINLTDSAGEDLINYKIYGNSFQDGVSIETHDAQSVGDRTPNIFDISRLTNTASTKIIGNTIQVSGYANNSSVTPQQFLEITGLKPGDTITTSRTYEIIKGTASDAIPGRISFVNRQGGSAFLLIEGSQSKRTSTVPSNFNSANYNNMAFYGANTSENGEREAVFSNIQISSGDTAFSYEPYGYRIPVKIDDGDRLSETINIYTKEPLAKVGDFADYVDYKTLSSYHYKGSSPIKTYLGNERMPALPSFEGITNYTVETQIEPSKMEVKYHRKK